MEQRRPPEGLETTLEQSRAAAMKLARSSDGKKLMELLQAQGDQVRRAAQEAARGNPGQLMAIVDRAAEMGIRIACLSEFSHRDAPGLEHTLVVNYSDITPEQLSDFRRRIAADAAKR